MPRYKYFYQELNRIPHSEPLPDDVNERLIASICDNAKKHSLLDNAGVEEVRNHENKIRTNRLFGEFAIIDGGGKPFAIVEYHKGIIKQYKLISKTKHIADSLTVLNDMVSFKKGESNENKQV